MFLQENVMAEETQDPKSADETTPETEAPETEAAETEAVEAAIDPAETEEDQGPDYGVAVEDAGTLKKKVTVTVPAEKIAAKQEEMFGELSSSAQVPGFRIGRAPRRLLEKRFGKEVQRDVRNAILGDSPTIVRLNEPKTLRWVEPFYSTSSHNYFL